MDNIVSHYGFEFSTQSSAQPSLTKYQKCFQYTLMGVNLIFLIFGCVLMAVGSYALNSRAGVLSGQTLPQGIIVLGAFILLISFLGCCAAWRESRIALAIYFLFLLLFTIILLAVGIAVYSASDDALKTIRNAWMNNASPGLRTDLQNSFGCCGLITYNDSYAGPNCPVIVPTPDPASPGCIYTLQNIFSTTYAAAGACGIAFAIIMGAGMTFVCCLMSGIKQKDFITDVRKLHRSYREAKEDPGHVRQAGEGEGTGELDEYGIGVDQVQVSSAYTDGDAAGVYDVNNYNFDYDETGQTTSYDQQYGQYVQEEGTYNHDDHNNYNNQRRDSIDQM